MCPTRASMTSSFRPDSLRSVRLHRLWLEMNTGKTLNVGCERERGGFKLSAAGSDIEVAMTCFWTTAGGRIRGASGAINEIAVAGTLSVKKDQSVLKVQARRTHAITYQENTFIANGSNTTMNSPIAPRSAKCGTTEMTTRAMNGPSILGHPPVLNTFIASITTEINDMAEPTLRNEKRLPSLRDEVEMPRY